MTGPIRNRLLKALAPDDLERLRPHLEPVSFKRGQVLHSANRPIDRVYFVEEGLVSVLTDPDREHPVEVWLIGCEGLTGIPLLLGAGNTYHRYVAEVAGRALRIGSAELRDAMQRSRSLSDSLLRFVQVILVQTARVGACNARHSLQERLARWLLMAHDRVDGDRLELTHEFLSLMLGVRRAGITEAIGPLQKAGIIQQGQGRIQILSRARLEAASCNCYGITKSESNRILH